MTQPDPTADADVELVARTMYLADWAEATDADWPALPKIEATAYRRVARAVLDALAERGHGLAPVIAHQWSVRYPDGFVDGGRFTEAGARQRAAELGGEVVYRAVGPWITAAIEVKP